MCVFPTHHSSCHYLEARIVYAIANLNIQSAATQTAGGEDAQQLRPLPPSEAAPQAATITPRGAAAPAVSAVVVNPRLSSPRLRLLRPSARAESAAAAAAAAAVSLRYAMERAASGGAPSPLRLPALGQPPAQPSLAIEDTEENGGDYDDRAAVPSPRALALARSDADAKEAALIPATTTTSLAATTTSVAAAGCVAESAAAVAPRLLSWWRVLLTDDAKRHTADGGGTPLRPDESRASASAQATEREERLAAARARHEAERARKDVKRHALVTRWEVPPTDEAACKDFSGSLRNYLCDHDRRTPRRAGSVHARPSGQSRRETRALSSCSRSSHSPATRASSARCYSTSSRSRRDERDRRLRLARLGRW